MNMPVICVAVLTCFYSFFIFQTLHVRLLYANKYFLVAYSLI